MSAETATCPWCSASVPVAAVTCPSCGASLRDAADGEIAGVTQVDPGAVLRAKRIKSRGIAAWLAGERETEDAPVGRVEPLSDEVRREMLRLELAAIDAELDAKTAAAQANRELGRADPGKDSGAESAAGSDPDDTADATDAPA